LYLFGESVRFCPYRSLAPNPIILRSTCNSQEYSTTEFCGRTACFEERGIPIGAVELPDSILGSRCQCSVESSVVGRFSHCTEQIIAAALMTPTNRLLSWRSPAQRLDSMYRNRIAVGFGPRQI
jgi:hypothetical protein